MAYQRPYQQSYHTGPQYDANYQYPSPTSGSSQDPNFHRPRNEGYSETSQWPEQDRTWSPGEQQPYPNSREGVRNYLRQGQHAEATRQNPMNEQYGASNHGPGYYPPPNREPSRERASPHRSGPQHIQYPMGEQGMRRDPLPNGNSYASQPQRSDGYYGSPGPPMMNQTNMNDYRFAPERNAPGPFHEQQQQQPQQQRPARAPQDRAERNMISQREHTQGSYASNKQPRRVEDPRGKPGRAPKERILMDPTSPGTVSWDNPFPTFPTNKKKPKQTGAGDLISAAGDMSLDERSHARRREEGYGFPNAVQRNTGKPLHTGQNPYPQHAPPVEMYDRRIQDSNVPDPVNRPPNQAFHHPNDMRPQADYGRRSEDNRRNLPFNPPPGFREDGQRSRTMPSAISESMADFHPPNINNNPPRTESGRPRTGDQTPRRGNHTPVDPHASRPPMPFRSHSREVQPVYAGHAPQTIQPSPHLSQQGSFGEVFDSYYHSPHHSDSYYKQNETGRYRTPSEADMPNFDAVPVLGASHHQGMTIDDHLNVQKRLPNIPPIPSQPPSAIPNNDLRPLPPTQGFPRSKSSPNLKDRGPQPSPQYSDGFNFELPGSVPAMYSRAPNPAIDNLGNDNVRREESFQPARSEWRQNDRRQQPQYAPQPPHPDRRPGTGGSQGRSPVLRSPDGQNRPPAFRNGSSRDDPSRPARNGPSPVRPRGPASPPVSQSSNPDALPAHPAPVRPDLVQGTGSIQPSRPPPVRQYSEGSSIRTDTMPVQKAQISRNPQKEDKSSTVTYAELDRLRQVIKNDPADNKTQLLLAKKLVLAASVLADEDGRADARTKSKNRERFVSDAYKLAKKAAQNGYTEAMFYLGDCYTRGQLGLEPDSKEAFAQYQSAAKLGHAQAAYRVAVCCEMGLEDGGGTKRDPIKAIQWYQRAATLGDTPAMYKMGVIQLKGLLGQTKNTREALKWLQRAAEGADEENPHALHELALLHESSQPNDGIRKDEAYAKQLFTQSANLGYKFSQFRLGCAYEYGLLGCVIDPRQSIAWYSKAAVQDEHQSELALSGWYLTGSEGVLQQSDTEAYLWARKAAQAGLAKAEYAMGYFTEVGIGTGANIEDAKRWYWRSASQNFPKARERLEDLRRGGAKMQKTRVSRSKINKQSEVLISWSIALIAIALAIILVDVDINLAALLPAVFRVSSTRMTTTKRTPVYFMSHGGVSSPSSPSPIHLSHPPNARRSSLTTSFSSPIF
ncbi:MAG: hypothetical protein Q9203_003752 [Teloschistes exilis]